MRKLNIEVKNRDEFEERLDLYIYLLNLCQDVTHAQKVFNSWLKSTERKKKAS